MKRYLTNKRWEQWKEWTSDRPTNLCVQHKSNAASTSESLTRDKTHTSVSLTTSGGSLEWSALALRRTSLVIEDAEGEERNEKCRWMRHSSMASLVSCVGHSCLTTSGLQTEGVTIYTPSCCFASYFCSFGHSHVCSLFTGEEQKRVLLVPCMPVLFVTSQT